MPDRIPRLSFKPVSPAEQRKRELTPAQRSKAIIQASRLLDKQLLRELQSLAVRRT